MKLLYLIIGLLFSLSLFSENIALNSSQLFPFGVDNRVYLLESDSEKSVAKLYTKKSMEEVQKLIQKSELFISNKFPVPKVLRCFVYENLPCVILEYKEGAHPLNPTLEQLTVIGKKMAEFHLQTADPTLFPICNPLKDLEGFFNSCSEFHHCAELEAAFREHDLKNFWNDGDLFQGPLHGDFSPTNLLMQGDTLTAILDIDHCSFGPAIADLARSFIFFCFDDEGQFVVERQFALLKGYETRRSLTAAEKKVMKPFFDLWLTRMILETYYHTDVLKAVSKEIFTGPRAFQSPDALFNRWKGSR